MLNEIMKEAGETSLWNFILLGGSGYLIFSLVQGTNKLPCLRLLPTGQGEMTAMEFLPRASRGSSRVTLPWSASFLYKTNLCPEARDFFSTRNLLLRENWSPHQKTWTQSCFQSSQGGVIVL